MEFGDSILRDAAEALIHVRMPPPPVDEESNFTLSDAHTSNFCRTIPFYLQICDFTRSPQVCRLVKLVTLIESIRIKAFYHSLDNKLFILFVFYFSMVVQLSQVLIISNQYIK